MEERPESRRGKGVVLAGWALVVAGVIGVIGGVVPFSLNAFRILGGEKTWSSSSLAGHGVEALGLSVEWAMLSSAIGAYLGALLLASGRAWLKGLDAARLLTWIYVAGGVTVNATDLAIFLFHAETGPLRVQMILLDGIALAFPVAVGILLLVYRPGAEGA